MQRRRQPNSFNNRAAASQTHTVSRETRGFQPHRGPNLALTTPGFDKTAPARKTASPSNAAATTKPSASTIRKSASFQPASSRASAASRPRMPISRPMKRPKPRRKSIFSDHRKRYRCLKKHRPPNRRLAKRPVAADIGGSQVAGSRKSLASTEKSVATAPQKRSTDAAQQALAFMPAAWGK